MNDEIPDTPYTNVETYLAAANGQDISELPTPVTRLEQYLKALAGGGAGVKAGYYYNGKFYKDSAHTTEIPAKENGLYMDITDNANKLYTYQNEQYVEVAAGGAAITVLGHYDTAAELPASATVGDAYSVGTEKPYDIYVWNGESWDDIGPIQGPKGDTGATGAQGPQGAAGRIHDVTMNGTSKYNSTNNTAELTTVQNLTSATSTEPLAASQGKILNDRINNLQNIGRFLAIWNAATGLPATNPPEMPYTYKTGDYYRVGTIAQEYAQGPANMGTITLDFETFKSATLETTGLHRIWYAESVDMWGLDDAAMPSYTSAELGLTYTGTAINDDQVNINLTTTNYKPNGSSYDGTASSTVETETITEGSVYYYDGTNWKLQTSGGGGTVLDVQIDSTSILSGGVADFTSEAFTFTLANGTTLTKNILVKE